MEDDEEAFVTPFSLFAGKIILNSTNPPLTGPPSSHIDEEKNKKRRSKKIYRTEYISVYEKDVLVLSKPKRINSS